MLVAPFIGLGLVLTDPPRWLQIVCIIAILGLVAAGASLMRRRDGAWRPSETLPRTRDHER